MAKSRGALGLVGGDEFSSQCFFDEELIASGVKSRGIDASKAEVLIVPTAAAYENPAKKIQQGMDYFEKLGVKSSVLEIFTRADALNIDLQELKQKLEAATVIYLTSGSPMHLHSVLTNTDMWEEIKLAWNSGAVLVGAGAGGGVLCDYMVDARGGAFTIGLNIISAISMIPAYDQWSEEKIHRTLELAPKDIFVTGIPLQTTLISEAGQPWKELGSGTAEVFRDSKKITVQDLPEL